MHPVILEVTIDDIFDLNYEASRLFSNPYDPTLRSSPWVVRRLIEAALRFYNEEYGEDWPIGKVSVGQGLFRTLLLEQGLNPKLSSLTLSSSSPSYGDLLKRDVKLYPGEDSNFVGCKIIPENVVWC